MKMSNFLFQVSLLFALLAFAPNSMDAQSSCSSKSNSISNFGNSLENENSTIAFISSFSKKTTSEVENYLMETLGEPDSRSTRKVKYWSGFGGQKLENFRVRSSKGELSIQYLGDPDEEQVNKKVGQLVWYVSKLICSESKKAFTSLDGDLKI